MQLEVKRCINYSQYLIIRFILKAWSFSLFRLSVITFFVGILITLAYFAFLYKNVDRWNSILDIASNAWVTLIVGAAGAQIINHLIIEKRERKKNWLTARSKFYWPLYTMIINYFETSTAFRRDDLREQRSPYEIRKEIFEVFEKNIEYADSKILIAFHEYKRFKLYEDFSDNGTFLKELDLFFEVIELFYIKSLKNREIRYDDVFFKSRILFFQIWHLTYRVEFDDPDGAMSLRFMINDKILATMYNFKQFKRLRKKSIYSQKKKFSKILKKISPKEHYNELYKQFFEPENFWENSTEIFFLNLRKSILEDNQDESLTYYHREVLRQNLLENLYSDSFYKLKSNKVFNIDTYENLSFEKKMAYQYLNDKDFIEIINADNIITLRLTAKGMEKIENDEKELRQLY